MSDGPPTITVGIPQEIGPDGICMALRYLMMAADFCVQPETEGLFRAYRESRGDPLDEHSDLTRTLAEASAVSTALATTLLEGSNLASLVADLTGYHLRKLTAGLIERGATEAPRER